MSTPSAIKRSGLHALLASGEVVVHGPWPRAIVPPEAWRHVASLLAQQKCTLVALFGDPPFVHAALADEPGGEFGIVSLLCEGERFASLGRLHAPAIRLERAMTDLCGLRAEGLPDARPWLDHGKWAATAPLSPHPGPPAAAASAYAFLPVEGANLHQIPVGPVHAGIIEPGHFRFTANGETVARLEQRLGYVHKGIEALMAGASPERGARLAGRVSGDSTVAYAWAFARAIEGAQGIEVPPRALWLRAIMAELERLANHLGDIGAVCNDAAFALLHAQFALLREQVLRAAHECFGHRLMMDCIVPGGVRADLPAGALKIVAELVRRLETQFPELVDFYDNTASLQDRTVGTGVLSAKLARQFGAGGFVGRASGRAFDARRFAPYAPYDAIQFEVPVRTEGDVDARVWARIREVEQSLGILGQALRRIEPGSCRAEGSPWREGEGAALVEGFRGDIFAWVRMAPDGSIARCHLRDPSWFQWPLLEAAVEGNIVADFPLCNKSFNCSYSGHDL